MDPQPTVTSSSANRNADLLRKLDLTTDAKVLIVHADDFGMTHSVNAASIAGFGAGVISSASVMVPCPWFPEAANYLRDNPSRDYGIHLTLTSEWSTVRWHPILGADRAPSLVDEYGFFHGSTADVLRNYSLNEVGDELQAQIDRARKSGLAPSHLDSHMYALYQRLDLFELFLALGRENGIPCLVLPDVFDWYRLPASLLTEYEFLPDHVIRVRGDMLITSEEWSDYYLEALEAMPSGITQMVIHVSYDDEEMRAATVASRAFDSKWRHRDFEFLRSERFIKWFRNNIILTNWREMSPSPQN